MPTFSIRGPLQGELIDFLKASGFDCTHVAELVRDLTCLLGSYREEDVPLFPTVFVLPSPEVISSLSPGTQRVTVGTAPLGTAAQQVLKDCATLAVRGWAVYVAKVDTNLAQFGVFRALAHAYANSAEETMVQLPAEPTTPAVLIRNRGHLVVELRNTKNETFTASFTSAPASESHFAKHLVDFASTVCQEIDENQRPDFAPYLIRLLADVLQHCHGTLLGAYVSPVDGKPPCTLKDGVWLATPIDLAGAHHAAVETKDAQTLAALQACEALLTGMIASDGLVVFGTNGTILGYRIFLKPLDEERKDLPEKGGGRRRTYALMQRRLGAELKAAFFRSQDGVTECQKATV